MKDNDDDYELIPFSVVKAEALKNPEIAAAYYALKMHKKMVAELKAARLAESLTQEDIARRTGMKKQNISRFENGAASPTLNTVSRYAVALGGTFEFKKLHG
ncbi:helix-turn-helix transcriptional regulator [Rahnella laticis]|uniref:helix-turn-helix transcriptional regulator n=1 Tax=Rahnella TaxID=34037 RepID=UPI0018A27F6D|nr:helix-turn-helix transcriptional regulator [Rahnella laticis]MBF7993810.1 helix-turn-helix transcriptional regulator [Rahnella laticis]